MAKLEELVDRVAPEWRRAFVQFVETGEADEAFLNHLDRDEKTQEVVEQAFQEQSRALEGLAQALREGETATTAAEPAPPVSQAVASIGKILETAMRLPKAERHVVLEAAMTQASRDLAASAGAGVLRDTLSDLKQAAGVVEATIEK